MGKGGEERREKGIGHHCDSPSRVLPPHPPLTPSVLPPHTHPEEHSNDVRMDRFLITSPLPISSVCVHVSYVCERVRVGLYVDGECVWARVFLCVSVLEKADLRELCSTFTLLLIHPFALTVFARLDRMGGETKRV